MSDLVKAETPEEAIKQIRRIMLTAEKDIKAVEGNITKTIVKSSAYDDIKAVLGMGEQKE